MKLFFVLFGSYRVDFLELSLISLILKFPNFLSFIIFYYLKNKSKICIICSIIIPSRSPTNSLACLPSCREVSKHHLSPLAFAPLCPSHHRRSLSRPSCSQMDAFALPYMCSDLTDCFHCALPLQIVRISSPVELSRKISMNRGIPAISI